MLYMIAAIALLVLLLLMLRPAWRPIVAFLSMLFATSVAHAADDASRPLSVFLDPLMPIIGSLVAALIVAFVGWLWAALSRHFGVNIDAKYRDALQVALQNAAGLLLARAAKAAGGVQVPLGRPEIGEGVDYVLKSAPKAIEHFDLSPDDIGEKILAKIGLATAAK